MGVDIPLSAAGLVGNDAFGKLILDDCARHKIDVRHLMATANAPTSYTDVMTEAKGGKKLKGKALKKAKAAEKAARIKQLKAEEGADESKD